jgi:hypothetical protein
VDSDASSTTSTPMSTVSTPGWGVDDDDGTGVAAAAAPPAEGEAAGDDGSAAASTVRPAEEAGDAASARDGTFVAGTVRDEDDNATIGTMVSQAGSMEAMERDISVRDATAHAGAGGEHALVIQVPAATVSGVRFDESAKDAVAEQTSSSTQQPPQPTQQQQLERWGVLVLAVLETLAGFTLFNIGLSNGFTPLGGQAGSLLPAAYLEVPSVPNSPRYSVAGGVILVVCIIFAIGFVATRAEPALAVLGKTVEKATNGAFSSTFLLYSVCVGVGVGMSVGTLKILFSIGVIYFLIGKYSVVLLLTAFTNDALSSVAWDSAGVTTGPVTVPFVLSIGIGAGRAVHAPEGFGILTTASVTPILTVLVAIMVQGAVNYRRELAQAKADERSSSEEEGGGASAAAPPDAPQPASAVAEVA